MDENPTDPASRRQTTKLNPTIILVSIGVLLLLAAVLLYPEARQRMDQQKMQATRLALPTPLPPSPSPTAVPSPTPAIIPSNQEIYTYSSHFGILILSIQEGTDAHLFAYQPFLEESEGEGFSGLPLTRLTSGPYQDITPDISPDGRYIAFSSNRGGPWDIYLLDLQTGEIKQFTDTLAYDANPSWSPDGAWLAYESYQIDNLEILLQDRAQTTGPIPLTRHPAADFSPDWSSQGRLISFVSSRSGQLGVWYADLDSPEEDKAIKIANLPEGGGKHPAWSPDGRYLTWAVTTPEGNHSLVTWDSQHPEEAPVYTGPGDWPLWSGSSDLLYAVIEQPQGTYLTGYPGLAGKSQLMLPALQLPGPVEGLSWYGGGNFTWSGMESDSPAPTPLWMPQDESANSEGPAPSRLVNLRGISAPYPKLEEQASESFLALRTAVISAAGWDFLSNLENAYVPLDQPISPGLDQDWLHTGRGLALDDVPRRAGWLKLVREDFDGQIYWRVFIRANNQQGQLGEPLQSYIWDLDARYSGSSSDYENGGALSEEIPSGYWVDFTALAQAYGWQRFPADIYWRASEEASQYQYYAFTQGLSLQEALAQIYTDAEIHDFEASQHP